MIKSEELFRIGRLTRPHGVKGEIALQTECDASTVFDAINADSHIVCEMDGIWVPFFLTSCRRKSDTAFLVRFENMDTEEKARRLAGKTAHVPADTLPEAVAVQACPLAGYTVFDQDRCETGCVEAVDDSTLNVLLQVTDNGQGRLIPIAFVTRIDHVHKTLTVTLPEGFSTI